MTAQAVSEERAAEASGARLALYHEVLSRIRDAWTASDYDQIWTVRDDLTRWAPWVISLPVWELASDTVRTTQEDSDESITARKAFNKRLDLGIQSLATLLEGGDERGLPNDLLGDISADVEQYTKRLSASALAV
ncbi:MAG: hypothetical protein JWM87_2424 [Candidatus Eremiobacteraeota bacterium]|nr:hypothetical protein [Candidatus Eremiobacteraeota bacterium]